MESASGFNFTSKSNNITPIPVVIMESTASSAGSQRKVIRRVRGSKSLSRHINDFSVIHKVSAVACTEAGAAPLTKSETGGEPGSQPSLTITKGGTCTSPTTQLHKHSSTAFKQRKINASTATSASHEETSVMSVVSGEPAPRPLSNEEPVDDLPPLNLQIGLSNPSNQRNVLKKRRASEPFNMARPSRQHSCLPCIKSLFRQASATHKPCAVIGEPYNIAHNNVGKNGGHKEMTRHSKYVGRNKSIAQAPDVDHRRPSAHKNNPGRARSYTDIPVTYVAGVGPDRPLPAYMNNPRRARRSTDKAGAGHRRCPPAYMNNPKVARRAIPQRGRKLSEYQAKMLAIDREAKITKEKVRIEEEAARIAEEEAKANVNRKIAEHVARYSLSSLPASDQQVDKLPIVTPAIVRTSTSLEVSPWENHGSGVINELSASASNEALRNPRAGSQEVDNIALGSPVVLTRLTVSEPEDFGASFAGTILAEGAVEVTARRGTYKPGYAASRHTLSPLEEAGGGVATTFQVDREIRVEGVPPAFRERLPSVANELGVAHDLRLGNWEWSSVPILELHDPRTKGPKDSISDKPDSGSLDSADSDSADSDSGDTDPSEPDSGSN